MSRRNLNARCWVTCKIHYSKFFQMWARHKYCDVFYIICNIQITQWKISCLKQNQKDIMLKTKSDGRNTKHCLCSEWVCKSKKNGRFNRIFYPGKKHVTIIATRYLNSSSVSLATDMTLAFCLRIGIIKKKLTELCPCLMKIRKNVWITFSHSIHPSASINPDILFLNLIRFVIDKQLTRKYMNTIKKILTILKDFGEMECCHIFFLD
jgi:hypothetical protein